MLSRTTAVFVCILLISGAFVAKAETGGAESRIMILPFDGTSSGKFSYLTDSIRGMISSRLSAKSGVEVVDYGVNAEESRLLEKGTELSDKEAVFSRFKTDYMITGALYELQTGLKIQVTLAGSKMGALEGKFSALAVNESKIIESVEGLVQDIVARGLGIQGSEVNITATTEREHGFSEFSTEHPERIFKKGVYGGSIVSEDDMAVQALGVMRSSPIPTMIVSMSVGDIDNDGSMEIVAASRTSVEIFQFDDVRFRKLASHDFGASIKIHEVRTADLNGDGLQEIIVSANKGARVASAILGWRRSAEITRLLSDIRYYLRPVEVSGEGIVLVGQRGSDNPVEGYVRPGLFRMVVAPKITAVQEGDGLAVPHNINLFDFVWADLDGNGSIELVAVDEREKLLVYDSGNNLIWVSEEDYGGSRKFIGPTRSSVKKIRDLFGKGDEADFDRKVVFIPARMVAVDTDGDGSRELIVGKNVRRWTKWFSNTREYDGGAVACLKWQNGVMRELWHTNKIIGYVADYGMYIPADDKTAQLYVTQIPERMLLGFMLHEESKLLRYELLIEENKKL